MNKIRTAFIVFGVIVIFSFYYVNNHSFAYGAMDGMMHGMMGAQKGSKGESPKTVNTAKAKMLLGYIKDEHLNCMQCHAVTKNMFGPSFAAISVRSKDLKDSMSKLSDHIAHGVGRMPPGYANEKQAHALAKQILGLTEESDNSETH